MKPAPQDIIAHTQKWLETFVIDLVLCPFAKAPYATQRIHFQVSQATDQEALLEDLTTEIQRLLQATPEEIETTLLIHPNVLTDFYEYNSFLQVVDGVIEHSSLSGILQIASFHPEYQFAGTHSEDAENYTNRSPYPTLHIIREDSISKAVDQDFPVDDIPERNIELMENMGKQKLLKMFEACFQKGE